MTPHVALVPVRIGTKVIGLLGLAGTRVEAGTLDALAGMVAIAAERAQFLAERRTAELTRQRAELSSAVLASLSHDLRTPLTAIRVAVSNIQDTSLPPAERDAQAALAMGQLQHLTRLFDEILDMARIEADAVQARRQWVSAADIVDAALATSPLAVGSREVRVHADADRLVEVDPQLTSAAITHLVENAAQYSPDDTAIDIDALVTDEGLRIAVTDRGPGLEPKELDKLFEPLFRGARARQLAPGTGMGLAITRGLLAAEGGRVWAENVARAARGSRSTCRAGCAPSTAAGIGRMTRILVVDDEPSILAAMVPLLQARDYDVVDGDHGPCGARIGGAAPAAAGDSRPRPARPRRRRGLPAAA